MMRSRHSTSCRCRITLLALAASALAYLAPAAADPVGYTVASNAEAQILYEVDLGTLTANEIAPISGLDPWDVLRIGFNADGTLYGVGGISGEPLRLVTFDLITGEGTLIAELPFGMPDFSPRGLAGDPAGGLWLSGRTRSGGVILSVDAVTGAVGEPVELGGSSYHVAACDELLLGIRNSGAGGLVAIDPSTGEISPIFEEAPSANNGMAVGPDGGLWTAIVIPIMPNPVLVWRQDLRTGEFTSVGQLGIENLAIAPPVAGSCPIGAPLAIPTLSPLALVGLAALLALAALCIGRRHGRGIDSRRAAG